LVESRATLIADVLVPVGGRPPLRAHAALPQHSSLLP
jgi:hypothetical protein